MVVVTGNLGILSQSEIERAVTGGALPSATVRKRNRLFDKGILGGRFDESTAKNKNNKINVITDEKFSRVESFMNALGIKTASRKSISDNSLISGVGPTAGIQKPNQFKELKTKVEKIQDSQKAIAETLGEGTSLLSGASGLTSAAGLSNIIGSTIARFGLPVSAITQIALALKKEHREQYGGGGTRDARKLELAEDVSRTGIENENALESAEVLFLSNPQVLSGLARGPSNTENLRAGLARWKQRHEGTYN